MYESVDTEEDIKNLAERLKLYNDEYMYIDILKTLDSYYFTIYDKIGTKYEI